MKRPRAMFLSVALAALPIISCAAQSEESAIQTDRGEEIEAAGPEGPLKGTLLSASAPDAPVALIIPGSGPTDRDGNGPMGLRASTYRLLAHDLAERGITTARIDKRGMFGSESAVPDANAVTIADYVSDTRSWVDALRARSGADCIWLIGHSEGGLVALTAAQEDTIAICGLVLVAAPGRPMGEVLREQLRANPANAPLLDDALRTIEALEAGRRVDTSSMHPALGQLFAPAVQGFLISAFALDPADIIAGLGMPILIMRGDRDIQVSAADARALADANAAARLETLRDVNHVLKTVSSDNRMANAATYGDPDLPLAPGVAETVAAFIGQPGGTE